MQKIVLNVHKIDHLLNVIVMMDIMKIIMKCVFYVIINVKHVMDLVNIIV